MDVTLGILMDTQPYVGLLVGLLDGRLLAVEKKFFKKENPSLQFSEFVTSCFQ